MTDFRLSSRATSRAICSRFLLDSESCARIIRSFVAACALSLAIVTPFRATLPSHRSPQCASLCYRRWAMASTATRIRGARRGRRANANALEHWRNRRKKRRARKAVAHASEN